MPLGWLSGNALTNRKMHVKLMIVLTLSARAFFGVVWSDLISEV
jgi:hypothetical protein